MKRYKITKLRYFEETVFNDTTTTVISFMFERVPHEMTEQTIEWTIMPSNINKTFTVSEDTNWLVGGEIYSIQVPDNVHVRRHVEGQPLRDNEQQTFITLNALDSGLEKGRIKLSYKKDYIYPAIDTSRTYATFRISGIILSEDDQIKICEYFNKFIEDKRDKTHSLFLPQYRESKLYSRKRIPFELAYKIFLHILYTKFL